MIIRAKNHPVFPTTTKTTKHPIKFLTHQQNIGRIHYYLAEKNFTCFYLVIIRLFLLLCIEARIFFALLFSAYQNIYFTTDIKIGNTTFRHSVTI